MTQRDSIAQLRSEEEEEEGLRNEKLAERVARLIVNDIFSNGSKPGTRLPPERQMLERFGVSRGTLREGLRILEVHGLLMIKAGPNGGPVVNTMTAKHLARIASLHYKAAGATVRHIWEARAVIEPMMARRAAEACTKEAERHLVELLEESARVDPDNDVDYIKMASEFHRAIASMTGNPILDLLARSLGDVTSFIVTGDIFAKRARQGVHEDHQRVVEAIIGRDPDLAERLMKEHMEHMLRSHSQRYPGALKEPVPYIT